MPCAACETRERGMCGALAPEELHQLVDILTDVELSAHAPLFHEGDPAEHVFNVTRGSIKLYKLLGDGRRQITGFMFPGDFLGLAVNSEYVYTAEAVTDVKLCRFPRRKLDVLRERMPKLDRRLLALAMDELVAAQDQMLLLGRKTAEEKIVSFLLMLARGQERRGEKVDPVHLPMSRTDIGDYLGLTIETVSRTLSSLRKAGAIVMEGTDRVHLKHRDRLEEVAAAMT
ncbi:MAG: helix-turn-helix domain-containing protein [Alphaproteobacteria bacterium]|nr:helix-turn-helix domain-containing protein [Alphaproteobacteria bacterium]